MAMTEPKTDESRSAARAAAGRAGLRIAGAGDRGAVALFGLLAILLSACGQSGELTLPGQLEAPGQAGAATEQEHDDDEEDDER